MNIDTRTNISLSESALPPATKQSQNSITYTMSKMIAIPRLNVRKWPLISSVNSVEFPPIIPFAPWSSAAKNAAGRVRVETLEEKKMNIMPALEARPKPHPLVKRTWLSFINMWRKVLWHDSCISCDECCSRDQEEMQYNSANDGSLKNPTADQCISQISPFLHRQNSLHLLILNQQDYSKCSFNDASICEWGVVTELRSMAYLLRVMTIRSLRSE